MTDTKPRKFISTMGDTYIGYVIRIYDSGYVVMDNYTVWYYGESEPYNYAHFDDSVQFLMEQELPL